jgi:hypothetical protein
MGLKAQEAVDHRGEPVAAGPTALKDKGEAVASAPRRRCPLPSADCLDDDGRGGAIGASGPVHDPLLRELLAPGFCRGPREQSRNCFDGVPLLLCELMKPRWTARQGSCSPSPAGLYIRVSCRTTDEVLHALQMHRCYSSLFLAVRLHDTQQPRALRPCTLLLPGRKL